MNCPTCQSALNPLRIGEVQIDECPECRGIWFDKGELTEARDEVDPDLRFMDFEIWNRREDFDIGTGPIDCPRCRDVPLRTVNFREPDIDIIFCPSCEGVWLHAGDFHKIHQTLRDEAASKSISDYAKMSLKEAGEILASPGKAMSEWKDLKAVLRMLRYRIFVENPKFRSMLMGLQKSLPL